MDPMTLMAIAAAGQGIFGGIEKISAASQRKKAQRFFEKNKYEIPSGVSSMLDIMGGLASQRELPGEEMIRQRLGATTSQGVETATRVARSPSDVLGALQNLYSKEMDSQQDLAIASAQNWQRNQVQYANALHTMGQYQTEKWKYNTLYPYMQKMAAAGETDQAGNQNIASGISSGLSIFSADQQMKQDEARFAATMKSRGLNADGSTTFSPTSLPQLHPKITDINAGRTYNNPFPITDYNGLEPFGEGSWSPYQ